MNEYLWRGGIGDIVGYVGEEMGVLEDMSVMEKIEFLKWVCENGIWDERVDCYLW